MKLYRTKIKLTAPGMVTETYFSPYVTLFPSFLCSADKEISFINECKFLYYMEHIKHTEGENEYDPDDITVVSTTYKTLKYNPLKDLWNRFTTLYMFKI